MNIIKKIIKSLLITTITFLILTFIITTVSYFNLLNYKTINIIKFIIPIISVFIGGIKMGKSSVKKGWLEGIKFSSVIIIILIITTIILKKFKLEYLIYTLIILTSGMLGSMIGINKK